MSEPVDKAAPGVESVTSAEPHTLAPVTQVPTAAAPALETAPAPEPPAATDDRLKVVDRRRRKSRACGYNKLPEVFAAINKGSPPTSVEIWGVKLDPYVRPCPKEYLILYKFLKARDMVLDNAKTMLVDALKWRQEMNIPAIMEEAFPEDVFGKLGVVAGKDNDGRPVTYNVYSESKGKVAEVFGDLKRFIRWRVQLMEKGVAQLDFENVGDMIQVHDYSGLGSGDRTPESKTAASEASKIFGDNYPELLYRKYFVGVPGYLTWVFWLFKAIVPSQTFAKMQVVGIGKEAIGKELLQLPEKYGGEATTIV
ncbi:CRAL-TRIO domain-containing protein [Auriculariales sp. MPI-PUGE-AT-0066]|nr:CRAL-TRIO domain-containing protein [Auriculariales sp. MPI-PUGE-AT-0066]